MKLIPSIPAPTWMIEQTGQMVNEYELRLGNLMVKKGMLEPFTIVNRDGSVAEINSTSNFKGVTGYNIVDTTCTSTIDVLNAMGGGDLFEIGIYTTYNLSLASIK